MQDPHQVADKGEKVEAKYTHYYDLTDFEDYHPFKQDSKYFFKEEM